MPKVGGKKFSYSKAGQKAAKSYAKSTGKTVTKRKPKRKPKSINQPKLLSPLRTVLSRKTRLPRMH